MRLRFLGQPFPRWEQAGGVLNAALEDAAHDKFWTVTAWAKRSGLSRIANGLQALRDRGGTSEAIVGVDEGGATKQGLRLAIQLIDEPYVFHDRGARTFHPKLYVVEGDASATAIIGSGNLTKGGLFTNYEAGLAIEIDKSVDDDAAVLAELRGYFDELMARSASCSRLDEDLIAELLKDPSVVVESERKAYRTRRARRSRAGDDSTLFGGVVEGLRGAPSPADIPIEDDDDDELPEAEQVDDTEDDDSLGATDVADPGEPGEHEEDEAAEEEEAAPASDGAAPPPAPPAAPPPAPPPAPAPAPPPAPPPSATPAIPRFWKAMSANDVSLHDSPGQIIIPIRYQAFFPPLTVQMDNTATGGPRQEHAEFTVEFRDGSFTKTVQTGRVILYVPAKAHKRPNRELRFTFRDRDILTRLSQDDVLEFSYDPQGGHIVVERHAAGWRPGGIPLTQRFGPK